MTQREQDLQAALIWLRNHYQLGNEDLKREVLERVDRVLANGEQLQGSQYSAFLKKYPR